MEKGIIYGRLKAIQEVKKKPRSVWEFQCSCGKKVKKIAAKVRCGHTKSCGCLKKEVQQSYGQRMKPKVTIHGKNNSNIYRVWVRMKQRCYNPQDKAYKHYGGRGLKVSKSWQSFENWYRDMGDKPTPKHTLERIDNNKGYSKQNCKWATMLEQGNNRRNNVRLTYNGKIKTISEWAREYNLGFVTLKYRLKKWNINKALNEPTKKHAQKH